MSVRGVSNGHMERERREKRGETEGEGARGREPREEREGEREREGGGAEEVGRERRRDVRRGCRYVCMTPSRTCVGSRRASEPSTSTAAESG